MSQELFGPILPIVSVADLQEAIDFSNKGIFEGYMTVGQNAEHVVNSYTLYPH